jgi:hypothetical protein
MEILEKELHDEEECNYCMDCKSPKTKKPPPVVSAAAAPSGSNEPGSSNGSKRKGRGAPAKK